MDIDSFISKKEFESTLFKLVRDNIWVFNKPHIINVCVENVAPYVINYSIEEVSMNLPDIFGDVVSDIMHKVSKFINTYNYKNCVAVIIEKNKKFITFTYQFSETQMSEFMNP